MPVDSRWTRSLDKPAAEIFRQSLLNDTLVLSRLTEILESEYDALTRAEESEAQFDTPNWALLASFRNGEKSRLKRTLALLSFLKD